MRIFVVMVIVILIVSVPVIVVVVVVVIAILVGVAVFSVTAVLRDAGLADGNQIVDLVPVADTIHLSAVVVAVYVVACVRDSDDGVADVPAAVGDVVSLELGAPDDVAHEHETGEGEQLLSAHDGGWVG